MKKNKLLEFYKKGTDFSFIIPENTKVEDINQALALFFIETAKYRGISPQTALAEIQLWLTQLEEHL